MGILDQHNSEINKMYAKILNKKRLFVAFVLFFIAIWWSLPFKSI